MGINVRKSGIAYAAAAFLLSQSVLVAETNSTVKLQEITVSTATGYEQDISDAPATISVITAKDIEGKSYRDVTDMLNDIPGVTVEGGAGGKLESTAIYIRGMAENYTLFLVDGKAQGSSQAYYNGYGSANEIGWLPPASAIERIEVVRGPMSSLYGSEAMGGVVNIITKKVAKEWNGSVTLDTVLQEKDESGDSRQLRYYLSGPMVDNVLGISLYGSFYHRDEDNTAGGFRRKDKQDSTAKVNWKVNDSNDLELVAGYAEQENLGTAIKTGSAILNNDRKHFALTHNLQWGENIKTTTYATHEDVIIDNGNNDSEYLRTTYNTKTVIPLDFHMITAGAELKQEQTNHDPDRFHGALNSTDLKRWQAALFTEDEWALTDNFIITGGLRFDKNEHYGNEIIPRLYGVYKLTSTLSLKGGISKGYKAPDLKQADPSIGEQSGGNGQSVDIGNYDLQPETSQNYEIGLAWNDPSGFNASLTAYHTDFKDKISKVTICSSGSQSDGLCIYNGKDWRNISEYVNISDAELQGIEGTVGYTFDKVKTTLGYTYSESEQKSGTNIGKPLNNLPKHMASLGVDWMYTKNLSFWTKAKYKGETIEDGTSQRPEYTLVDAGINYKISKDLSVYAGMYNLFDKEITTTDFGKNLDGRRFNLGITASF